MSTLTRLEVLSAVLANTIVVFLLVLIAAAFITFMVMIVRYFWKYGLR